MNPLEKVLLNIELLLNQGIIDDNTAALLTDKAYLDYDDLTEDNGDFNQMSNLAEFSAATDTNLFGQYMLSIGEELGYDDIYEYVGDLSDAFDSDPEVVVGILAGEYLPTEEFIDSFSNVVDIDEDLYDALYDSAAEAYLDSGLVDEVLAEYEEAEEEYYDYDYDEEPEYYQDEEPEYYVQDGQAEEIALAALEEAQEANYNAAVLQDQMAEFSAIAEINSALDERQRFGLELVSSGKMPPVVFEDLFGAFDSDDERLAAFSQVCEYNGTDAAAELYAIDKQLETFANYGDNALFNRHAYDYVDEEVLSEEVQEYEEALLNRQLAEAKKANLI